MAAWIAAVSVAQALPGRLDKRAAAICSTCLLIFAFLLETGHPDFYSSISGAILLIFYPISTVVISVREIIFRKAIYLAALVLGIITALSSLSYLMVCILLSTDISPTLTDLILVLLLTLFCAVAAKRGKLGMIFGSVMQVAKLLKSILLGSVWLSVLLASVFSVAYIEYLDLHELAVIGLLTAVLLILLGIILPLLIVSSLSKAHYMNMSGMMDKQVRAQVEHFEAMAKKNEDIKRFRHDYNNQRLVVINLLENNEVDSALALLRERSAVDRAQGEQFDTGNVVLDALLNEKRAAADAVNAKIEFDGVVPSGLLSLTDLCVIFGNALDNAIEACAKCSHEIKVISVHSTFSTGYLFVSIENPVAADVRIGGNHVATTKDNKGSHGIGLRSIKTAVERNSGEMKLSCADKLFTVEIVLDLYRR